MTPCGLRKGLTIWHYQQVESRRIEFAQISSSQVSQIKFGKRALETLAGEIQTFDGGKPGFPKDRES